MKTLNIMCIGSCLCQILNWTVIKIIMSNELKLWLSFHTQRNYQCTYEITINVLVQYHRSANRQKVMESIYNVINLNLRYKLRGDYLKQSLKTDDYQPFPFFFPAFLWFLFQFSVFFYSLVSVVLTVFNIFHSTHHFYFFFLDKVTKTF